MASTNRFHRLKAWFYGYLGHTHDHYALYLPNRIGRLTFLLLRLFFSGIKLSDEQTGIIRGLPPDAIIVYVTKYKSRFEYFFYYTRYRMEKLPFPQIGFDYRVLWFQPIRRLLRITLARLDYFRIHRKMPDPYTGGYIRRELLNGRTALLSLAEKQDFYRRFIQEKTDPLQYLIDMQLQTDQSIVLAPQLFFFGRHPQPAFPSLTDILFGSEQRPGRIRKLYTLLKNPSRIFIETSEPLFLKDFIEHPVNQGRSPEQLALVLRSKLLSQINRHRQSITGPVRKSSEELNQSILTGDRLVDFMDKYAKRRNVPVYDIHREGRKIIDEIAARPSPAFLKWAYIGVGWFAERMFEEVDVNEDGIKNARRLSRRGPLILVPCHKSHIDYLIISYLLYANNMPVPLVFAGENLSFWPVGLMLRRTGAFFVRRSLSGAVLYTKILADYLYKLLEEGYNIEFFIEGTRSRSGKLLPPQLGALSMLLNAYRAGACEEMSFVPVYIGYDRVPEEGAYVHEIEGGQKTPESFWSLLKARRLLRSRYGKIYLHFGEPIPVRALEAEYGAPVAEMTSKQQNLMCRDLGYRMLTAIEKAAVITPQALVAGALLAGSKEIIPKTILTFRVDTILTYLVDQNARLSESLIMDRDQAVDGILIHFENRKFIEVVSDKKIAGLRSDAQYRIVQGKRTALEYYKNNFVAAVIPAAITALLIFEKEAFQFSAADMGNGYLSLQELLSNEFPFPSRTERPPAYLLRKTIKSFIDDAILIPHPTLPDTYNITATGYRKLKVLSNFLQPFLEVYWAALSYFRTYAADTHDEKERLKKMLSLGHRMWKKGEIERREALSKIYFSGAASFFTRHGVRGSENEEAITRFSDMLRHHLDHLPV
ncbi:MAG: 1-acyl-sn-glycerol-3-phosphate acyltransferase [Desulfobacterales bacterium]